MNFLLSSVFLVSASISVLASPTSRGPFLSRINGDTGDINAGTRQVIKSPGIGGTGGKAFDDLATNLSIVNVYVLFVDWLFVRPDQYPAIEAIEAMYLLSNGLGHVTWDQCMALVIIYKLGKRVWKRTTIVMMLASSLQKLKVQPIVLQSPTLTSHMRV